MANAHQRKGQFVKVGENLYRYSSNKIYYAVFRNKGKLIWRSLKTTDRDLAKRKLKIEVENQGRVNPDAAKMSLEHLLGLYEESIAQFDRKTFDTRKSILRKFRATWTEGFQGQVGDVTEAMLDRWLAKHRQRLKKSSYNEYVRFLRQTFLLALKSGAIAVSPAADLKELKRERPIRETPTWQQFQEIVSDIRTQRFNADADDTADVVEFMGNSGVGTAECANLKGEHIDFAAKRVRLYRKKTEVGYVIPIYPQAAPFLDALRLRGQIEVGKPVFKIRDPKKALAAACKRLKLPNFSSRALRRCFISRAIELGIDFKTIASWQGHHDGGVLIAKTYSHLRTEHADEMAKRLVSVTAELKSEPPSKSSAKNKKRNHRVAFAGSRKR